MKKLAIFDLDGTLLDTIGDLANAYNTVLKNHGFPPHTHNEYRYLIGAGVKNLIKKGLPSEFQDDINFRDQMLEEFIMQYNSHLHEETKPYEGIIEVLKELNRNDVLIAIASNKYQSGVDAVVKFYFSEIDFIATNGTSNEIPVKPNPIIVENIISKCSVNAEDILYFGDSGIDMQTAKNANLKAVGVLWGFRTKEELLKNGADIIIEKPEKILNLIME